MQLIPGFTPRRSGISESWFAYNAHDCDYSVCANIIRKKCISPDRCVCLREGLVGSCVSSHIHGVDFDGYMLIHTAKGLYAGTKHNSLPELTDPEP